MRAEAMAKKESQRNMRVMNVHCFPTIQQEGNLRGNSGDKGHQERVLVMGGHKCQERFLDQREFCFSFALTLKPSVALQKQVKDASEFHSNFTNCADFGARAHDLPAVHGSTHIEPVSTVVCRRVIFQEGGK